MSKHVNLSLDPAEICSIVSALKHQGGHDALLSKMMALVAPSAVTTAPIDVPAKVACNMEITVHSDGACKGNPGPGGWGYLMDQPGQARLERCGGEWQTTNNRMELMAVLLCMEEVIQNYPADTTVKIVMDSEYVRKGCTEWVHGWAANNWRKADKKPVVNDDLWKRTLKCLQSLGSRVSFQWIKGHSGHSGNERADQLANQGIPSSY